MKKSFSNILNVFLMIVIVIMAGSSVSNGISYSEAGSSTDPLVTLSYVEERMALLNENINERLHALENKSTQTSSSGIAYEVVEVQAGQVINLEKNTHFILRTGKATAIGGNGGGLSDLTSGKGIGSGENIDADHLILIPQSDGRGVTMVEYGYVMISGDYSIK